MCYFFSLSLSISSPGRNGICVDNKIHYASCSRFYMVSTFRWINNVNCKLINCANLVVSFSKVQLQLAILSLWIWHSWKFSCIRYMCVLCLHFLENYNPRVNLINSYWFHFNYFRTSTRTHQRQHIKFGKQTKNRGKQNMQKLCGKNCVPFQIIDCDECVTQAMRHQTGPNSTTKWFCVAWTIAVQYFEDYSNQIQQMKCHGDLCDTRPQSLPFKAINSIERKRKMLFPEFGPSWDRQQLYHLLSFSILSFTTNKPKADIYIFVCIRQNQMYAASPLRSCSSNQISNSIEIVMAKGHE